MLISFVFLLASCARVKVKDSEWCGDIGSYGASCFHTLTDETREVSLKEWEQERFGMICTKADNFADWKITILKLCRIAKFRCTYDSKTKMVQFIGKVEDFSEYTKNLPEYNQTPLETNRAEVEFQPFEEIKGEL